MSEFDEKTISELKRPLDTANIRGREQGGRSVSYIEGWHAIAEANRIFNFQWSRETIYCKEISRTEVMIGKGDYKKEGYKVGYEAKVRVMVGDIIKEGTGHGSGTMSDLYDCIESAAKEAETDAMKRALMMFGNLFGLALYDKDKRNVEDYEAVKRNAKSPEQKTHDWFIAKLATIINDRQFTEFIESQKNKDARDKLFLDSPELSIKVEAEIDKKRDWLHKQSLLQA